MTGFEELPGWSRIHSLGGWHTPNSTGTEVPLLRSHPLYLFIWLFICILYKIPIRNGTRKWSVSEFCEPFQQIIEPEKGAMETPNSQLAGRSTEGLGLAVGIWSGEQSYETEPLSCGVCTNSTKLSVRIKINCRTPTCCLERVGGLVAVGWKAPHIWCQKWCWKTVQNWCQRCCE